MKANNTIKMSLLYPSDKLENTKTAGVSDSTAAQLDLPSLLDLKEASISDFFSDDIRVLEYRQKTVKDIESNPTLADILSRVVPFLTDITELRQLSNGFENDGDSYLYGISEIEVYISLMQLLHDELLPLKNNLSSPAFTTLCEKTEELTEGEYFKTLTEHLAELSSRVRDIRSITVGINVDRKMMPESSGVLSVNSEQFKSGDFFERVKRLDFKKSDMTFISDLVPYSRDNSETHRIAYMNAINNAISDVCKTSVRSWKNSVQYYVVENTDFLLRMIPEIDFLCAADKLLKDLKNRGCTLTYPEFTNNKEYHVKALINPIIALKTDAELVANDLDFDENAMIYVITGPNRGGKSVLTCAVGYSFVMAQLGLPVCCDSITLSPADKIMTHFPTGSEDTVEKGRLGEECARLNEIFSCITENSLVLLDESLSSTGSYEGAIIASEVLEGFSLAKTRCIFSTHLHDLAAAVNDINNECMSRGGVKIENMVAEVTDGKRSFKIVKKTPDGKSYAKDIAKKYGLSIDDIMSKIKKDC